MIWKVRLALANTISEVIGEVEVNFFEKLLLSIFW